MKATFCVRFNLMISVFVVFCCNAVWPNYCCINATAKSAVSDATRFVTRHSLVRAKGEVFVLLYVFLFVRSTISRQPAGRFKPSIACGRILVPNVSSPLLGVSGPWRTEKWGNEIFVTMGVTGEFLHFGGF